MFSHPALVLRLIGRDTECKALLSEQDVSAVCRVDRPDRIILRELNDIAVFRIDVRLGVQTANEIVGDIAEVLESLCAHTGHDIHIQDNVDGIRHLNANLCKRRTDRTHAVRNDVHGSALHHAVIKRRQLGIHFLRIHPVIRRACVLLLTSADKGSVFHTSNVIRTGAMIQASRIFILIEGIKLVGVTIRQSGNLCCQLIQLFLGTVDPNDLIRLAERDHFLDPLVDIRVLCQGHCKTS